MGHLGRSHLPSHLVMRWSCRNGIMLVTGNDGSQRDERVGKEARGMHARVSKLEGPPEQVNEMGRTVAEWVAPSLT